eukprot:9225236-Pyramimonas_sp.AAC.1
MAAAGSERAKTLRRDLKRQCDRCRNTFSYPGIQLPWGVLVGGHTYTLVGSIGAGISALERMS